ncbi:hypothetical protein PVAP13_9KG343732 [Panicum virgatum]|uniref:Uncharacterized protein n=1 Tax=Panicum virgatum TaxID=38727 RepID=A0A8T0NKA8_PANVG|nr:hypothetical protein PVAP13_9KG343732 [Panicum virgatum]
MVRPPANSVVGVYRQFPRAPPPNSRQKPRLLPAPHSVPRRDASARRPRTPLADGRLGFGAAAAADRPSVPDPAASLRHRPTAALLHAAAGRRPSFRPLTERRDPPAGPPPGRRPNAPDPSRP